MDDTSEPDMVLVIAPPLIGSKIVNRAPFKIANKAKLVTNVTLKVKNKPSSALTSNDGLVTKVKTTTNKKDLK